MQIFGTTEQRHEERLCLATFAACLPRGANGFWQMSNGAFAPGGPRSFSDISSSGLSLFFACHSKPPS